MHSKGSSAWLALAAVLAVTPAAIAHPGGAIAVSRDGEVATGCRTVVKLGQDGGVASVLRAEAPWSPTAVARHAGELYVLEYDHSLPERQWTPRVRKLAKDGRVVTLATVLR